LICKYGYEYYEENPALSINVVIKNILQECGILEKIKKRKINQELSVDNP
jgi:hypothetical protein